MPRVSENNNNCYYFCHCLNNFVDILHVVRICCILVDFVSGEAMTIKLLKKLSHDWNFYIERMNRLPLTLGVCFAVLKFNLIMIMFAVPGFQTSFTN